MAFRIGKTLIACRCLRPAAGFLLFLGLSCHSSPVMAGDISASENEVKSAYIYNLFLFVQWPEDFRSDWRICLFPDDPLYTQLNKLNGKTIADRTIQVRQTADPNAWPQCHLLVVPNKIKAAQKEALFTLRNRAVLTITDGEGPDVPHTTMYFYRDGGHIRMGVHYPRLKASGISISARLLKILKVRDMQGGLEP